MIDATLIADLIRAGVDADLVGRVANAIVSAKSADFPVDKTTEKRRAYDRERKRIEREIRGNPPTSAESASVALTTKEDSKKERKEVERAQRLSADWKPSSTDIEFALSKGMPRPRIDTEAEKFRNYWSAKSGRDATKRDWPATWRNWVLSSLERSPGNPPTPPPGAKPDFSIPPWEREGITESAWRERELAKINGTKVRGHAAVGAGRPDRSEELQLPGGSALPAAQR